MPVNSSGMAGMGMMPNGHENQLMGSGPFGNGGMSMSNGPMGNGGMPPGSMGSMHMSSHQPNGMMPGNLGSGGMGGGMPMGGGMRNVSTGMNAMPNGYMAGGSSGGMMGNGGMHMHQMNMGGSGGDNNMMPSTSMPQGNSMQPGPLLPGQSSLCLLRRQSLRNFLCAPSKCSWAGRGRLPQTCKELAVQRRNTKKLTSARVVWRYVTGLDCTEPASCGNNVRGYSHLW